MKIALIYLGRRGAGLPVSLELAQGLAVSDEVICVLSTAAAAAADWNKLGVELITTATYENLTQAVWSWIDRRRIHHLADQIAVWKPDVLLFPMFYTWNPFLQYRLRQIPSVVAVHDPRPHPGLSDKLFQWLENRSIRQAARGLVFSQSLAPELARRGIDLEKIDVISLGAFDYKRGKSLTGPHTHDVGQKLPTLLFFGRITEYKGLDLLLQAFQKVRLRHQAQLLIAGEGDLRPYRPLLETCEGVDIINRWIADEEIPEIFQRADMVILPYTSASQSGVIPIAASFGLPVIATRTGGIPEQIQDGQNGLLVEPGSVEQLGAAIERLLTNPDFGRSLGQSLQDDFQSKHNWQQITSKVRASLDKARLT
jgi:glycosyltransferase involved in cell wall biosynthesis